MRILLIACLVACSRTAAQSPPPAPAPAPVKAPAATTHVVREAVPVKVSPPRTRAKHDEPAEFDHTRRAEELAAAAAAQALIESMPNDPELEKLHERHPSEDLGRLMERDDAPTVRGAGTARGVRHDD
jgi:hypothetical protein